MILTLATMYISTLVASSVNTGLLILYLGTQPICTKHINKLKLDLLKSNESRQNMYSIFSSKPINECMQLN